MKQESAKEKVIEQLQKTPIVQISCERAGIGRSTYYKWRMEDKKFAKMTDDALLEGQKLITDLAESKLIASIQDQSMSAIAFWLKSHHDKYRQKLELSGQVSIEEELTPKEKEIVERALKLSSFITKESIKRLNDKNYEE